MWTLWSKKRMSNLEVPKRVKLDRELELSSVSSSLHTGDARPDSVDLIRWCEYQPIVQPGSLES